MLNYIWAGLIILSLAFALLSDGRDLVRDTYRNGQPLPVVLEFPDGYDPEARRQTVHVVLDSAAFAQFYGTPTSVAPFYAGTLVQTLDGNQIRIPESAGLPEPLATIRAETARRDTDLKAVATYRYDPSGAPVEATLAFDLVRFIKLRAISQAALTFAETAVTISLGLIGVMALWLGLLRIAEKAGLINVLVRVVRPVLRPLFPTLPNDHPAFGMIALNLTANMLGLGNAATPLGIKAMEELQKENPNPDTATNDMVMLLAMNTASVQIVPPVLLVAIMGLQVNQLFFSILVTTAISLVVAIAAAKFFSKMKRFQS